MELSGESKTLFITLLGKAKMSEKGLFLKDNKLIDGLKIYLPLQVDGYTDFNV